MESDDRTIGGMTSIPYFLQVHDQEGPPAHNLGNSVLILVNIQHQISLKVRSHSFSCISCYGLRPWLKRVTLLISGVILSYHLLVAFLEGMMLVVLEQLPVGVRLPF